MKSKVIDAINLQISREFESAYIYQGIEMYIANNYNLPGFKNFFHIQAQEEVSHAYLMVDYLHRVGAKVALEALEKPAVDYKSILAAFEAGLSHEKKVTAWIHEIAKLTREENDFPAQNFIEFFVKEQVEEEETFRNYIDTIRFIDGNPHAMLLLDQELAQRVFVPPTIE